MDRRFKSHGLQLSAHNAFPLSKPIIFKWENQGDNQEQTFPLVITLILESLKQIIVPFTTTGSLHPSKREN